MTRRQEPRNWQGRRALSAALVAVAWAGIQATSAQEATPGATTAAIRPYEPALDLGSLGGEIIGDGSSTVWPVTDEAALRFMERIEDVRITVDFSGTRDGFEVFCAGETDIQDASRPISADEVAACAAGGIDYYVFEVGYDGISVVHPSSAPEIVTDVGYVPSPIEVYVANQATLEGAIARSTAPDGPTG